MAKKKQKGGQAAKQKSTEAQAAKTGAEPKAAKKAKGADAKTGPAGKVAQFREFLEEAKVELKKVTFPTRKETVATSTAVLVLVFIMALFLGLVDLGLSKVIEAILS